jgi:rRNA maturation endonuclease Nob1
MPVYCTSCRAQREVGDEGSCPACGAPAYRHKTTREEFAEAQRTAEEADRIGRALREREPE